MYLCCRLEVVHGECIRFSCEKNRVVCNSGTELEGDDLSTVLVQNDANVRAKLKSAHNKPLLRKHFFNSV